MKIVTLLMLISTFTGGVFFERLQPRDCLTQEQEDVLALLSVVQTTDCLVGPTLRVTGANLQIVNGENATDSVNGLGNVIIGYNENNIGDCLRSGSHSLIIGTDVEYDGYSNILAGTNIEMAATFNSVILGATDSFIDAGDDSNMILGGINNSIIGDARSIVLGGDTNQVTGAGSINSIVIGGESNNVSGDDNVILGGTMNTTGDVLSVVIGGINNYASLNSVTVGGLYNTAYDVSVVTGGRYNDAYGTYSVVSGGNDRSATDIDDWDAGSLFEDN